MESNTSVLWGGLVLDPFVGSGTTIIESYLKGRNSIGVELEYSALLENNIKHIQGNFKREATIDILVGDSREVLADLNREVDLVITGFPYPIIGANVTADKPMRFDQHSDQDYFNEKSLGRLKWKGNFLPEIMKSLNAATKTLKVGGKFITIIKDCMNNKKPFFLQKYVMEEFLNQNPNYSIHGWYLHRHTPETMFMNTYPKRYPDTTVPFYQVALILQKNENI